MGFSFDYKTIMIYFCGSILITILLFLFYLITSKQRSWQIIIYITGKVLQLLSVLGIIYRDTIPDFLSIQLSLFLLILSYSFEVFSITSYDGRFRKKLFYFLFGTILISNVAFALTNDIVVYRAAISSFSAAIIFGVGGIILFQSRGKLKFTLLISIVFIIFFFIQLIRGFIVLSHGLNYDLYEVNSIDTIFYISALIYISLASMGFLLLLKERDEVLILEKTKALEETTFYKNKLFRIIAHDLKNPIGAVASLGQLLIEQHNDLDSQQREEAIHTIADSSRETYDLLNNLLHWTQSESGDLTYNPEKLNLADHVNNNLLLFKNLLAQKNIKLFLHLKENTFAFADDNMMSTIVRNLLSNAIKFTPVGGKINVKVQPDSDELASIVIEDNGVGMSPEVISSLFTDKENKHSQGTNEEEGTGLGLKLCNDFILKNNGKINVTSKEGIGSTFEILIPNK